MRQYLFSPCMNLLALLLPQVKQLRWRAGASMTMGQDDVPPARFVRGAGLACRRGCAAEALIVRLQPMEIRTFRLTVAGA